MEKAVENRGREYEVAEHGGKLEESPKIGQYLEGGVGYTQNSTLPSTPTSDFFNLHGTVQSSLDKVTTTLNSSYTQLSSFLQNHRRNPVTGQPIPGSTNAVKSPTHSNQTTPRSRNSLTRHGLTSSTINFDHDRSSSSSSTIATGNLAASVPNADQVLQELDEYFRLEDGDCSAASPETGPDRQFTLSQAGADLEVELGDMSMEQLKAVEASYRTRTHKASDHLVQALAARDDQSIKHEIYQGIVAAINQLTQIYEQKSNQGESTLYVPRDMAFHQRDVVELKNFLDLLCSIRDDSPECARMLAKYVLRCSANM